MPKTKSKTKKLKKTKVPKTPKKPEVFFRPPIVTLLGHVDHGKTSLLDAIRESKLTEKEFGGITQHVNAYQVEVETKKEKKKITFIDTPGHAAFTAMRARGGQAADIVVLVVAADDGVMPQTIEAIDHARAAQVPIIVALNKIDLEGADLEKTKGQLSKQGLNPEEWGGETICVPVSAKTKEGLDKLLEMILLTAEIEELKADPLKLASGVVIESYADSRRGNVVSLVVKDGTLKVSDYLSTKTAWGKVKAMADWESKRIEEALPSTPVEILGFSNLPRIGEVFKAAEDETQAKEKVLQEEIIKEKPLPEKISLTEEELFSPKEENFLNIVLKTDVKGTLEAIRSSLERIESEELKLNFLRAAIGDISESDILLAQVTEAIVLGFNVNIFPSALKLAEIEGVIVRNYQIIYKLLEEVEELLAGGLEVEKKEKVLGLAEVLKLFTSSKGKHIAGSKVLEGNLIKRDLVEVLRDEEKIAEGKIKTLRHLKENKEKVPAGTECGVIIKPDFEFEEGDIIKVIRR